MTQEDYNTIALLTQKASKRQWYDLAIELKKAREIIWEEVDKVNRLYTYIIPSDVSSICESDYPIMKHLLETAAECCYIKSAVQLHICLRVFNRKLHKLWTEETLEKLLNEAKNEIG